LDVLVAPGGLQAEYSTPVVKGVDPHGTGCTYSAAIATCLAQGDGLREAVGRAKHFITSAIRQRHRFSKSSVLNHDPDLTGGDPVKRRG
jgi:hydroxymethylpyrimidine/phosphomethylpyrimidine kinase